MPGPTARRSAPAPAAPRPAPARDGDVGSGVALEPLGLERRDDEQQRDRDGHRLREEEPGLAHRRRRVRRRKVSPVHYRGAGRDPTMAHGFIARARAARADDGRRLRHRPGDHRRVVPRGRGGRRVRRRRRRRACGAPRRSPAACCRWRGSTRRPTRPALPPRCIPVLQAAGLPPICSTRRSAASTPAPARAAARCIEQRGRARRARGEVAGARHGADPQGGVRRRRHRLSRPHRDAAGARGAGGALPPVRMMLANDELRTVLVTIHSRCASAIDAITLRRRARDDPHRRRGRAPWGRPRRDRRRRAQSARRRGRPVRRRGAARHRSRRSQAARAEGIDASGPFAPDTVFMRARNAPGHPGEFDSSSR